MERICPLCCEGICNETHYIFECKNKEMTKVRNKCMEPFHKNWKGLENLSTENFYREILSGQNEDTKPIRNRRRRGFHISFYLKCNSKKVV